MHLLNFSLHLQLGVSGILGFRGPQPLFADIYFLGIYKATGCLFLLVVSSALVVILTMSVLIFTINTVTELPKGYGEAASLGCLVALIFITRDTEKTSGLDN